MWQFGLRTNSNDTIFVDNQCSEYLNGLTLGNVALCSHILACLYVGKADIDHVWQF